ncbi:hypothetical protein SAMN05216474_0883 [Lishizhenia tianjinensis]|uniref:Uncharacterized protein n=1 Tax=Lishizhenia tianjinensis TaxID=477690 RepID=A0A1I6YGA0_9FLAO|nr:hypothetical protein [Lishizhenia tianjinensis]SFT49559.1 hypothetical protein SAMN05216474_0883 [Lishizhenia tianjinensis]
MSFIFFSIIFTSCKNDASNPSSGDLGNTFIDTNENKPQIIVPDGELESLDTLINKEESPASITEEKIEIEKNFGQQWDFCNCVKALDSLTQALGKNNLSDQELDQLLQRSDYIDLKCKTITAEPSSTLEEREAHQKKVRKCLNN